MYSHRTSFSTKGRSVIEDYALDVQLREFLGVMYNKRKLESSYFALLYLTGCRPSEPLDIRNWKYKDDENIILTMPKTKEIRKFEKHQIPAIFAEAIKAQLDIYGRFTYDHMLRCYKKYSTLAGAVRKERLIQLYAFRHNRVKQYINSGMKKEKIMKIFAWINPESYDAYANSRIYI